jgi:AcrR family transcriptional regulator
MTSYNDATAQGMHMPQSPRRRVPRTSRGEQTREQILSAALRLASERWVSEIAFTELAEEAQVARASLLHAFPHWREVVYDLFCVEADRLDDWYIEATQLKRTTPEARAFAMLRGLIDRAEATGLLYPNIRSAMFTWAGEPTPAEYEPDLMTSASSPAMLGSFVRIQLSEHYVGVEDLLGIPPKPGKPIGPTPIGECLLNFAFDLAAGSPTYRGSFDERRETLRRTITTMAPRPRGRR